MNRNLRARIVEAMARQEGMTLTSVALLLGIARRTLSDYLTEEVRGAVEALRLQLKEPSVDEVDRAMLKQACNGNVAAARLVYMRMAQRGEASALPTLEEMEAELRGLREEERRKVRKLSGKGELGDGAAQEGTVGGETEGAEG